MKIFVINGAAGSGKDTFVTMCKKYARAGHILNISTVDRVKEIAAECGWDGTKTPENRKFLSNLKTLLTEWADVPLKDAERRISLFKAELESYDLSTDEAYVFIHCREPKEIQKLVDVLGAKTIIVRRAAAESIIASNLSDANVFNYHYDITINNNGSLAELDTAARIFIQYRR